MALIETVNLGQKYGQHYALKDINLRIEAGEVLALIGPITGDETAKAILTTVGCMIPGLLAALAIPGIIGGIGVLKLKLWARYLVLVLSVLALFSIPIGTAIGVYSIWVLIQDETAELFASGSGE